ncbi:MAG: hypothetical protein BGO48_11970 [Mucilaginibacter sp. 44-25]|nr:MAG: hypothetical protein BGO48_11970 [Mucilaginibacter sp. 44-25]
MKGFAFSPASVNIKVGNNVTWTNEDTAPHTATDNGTEFDSGSLATSATFTHTFTKAGTYTYICKIHSSMAAATVVVSN